MASDCATPSAAVRPAKGKVQDHLRTALKDDTLKLPEPFAAQLPQVKEILRKLAGKLDIKNADERRTIKTREAVLHGPEFQSLWMRHSLGGRGRWGRRGIYFEAGERTKPPFTRRLWPTRLV